MQFVQSHRFKLDKWTGVEAVTRALHWILPRDDRQTTHAIFTYRVNELATKSEKWNGKPDWHVSNLTFTSENSCGCNAQEMPERTEMTKHTDWREILPSQVVCVLADLKC